MKDKIREILIEFNYDILGEYKGDEQVAKSRLAIDVATDKIMKLISHEILDNRLNDLGHKI